MLLLAPDLYLHQFQVSVLSEFFQFLLILLLDIFLVYFC